MLEAYLGLADMANSHGPIVGEYGESAKIYQLSYLILYIL